MVTEEHVGPTTETTLRDLSEALIAVYGTDYGIHSPTWISRFTDMTRQAAAYRDGRVLLAGDAAHVHAPDGGQGLQTGVQDAVNLGWKLAQVVNRTSPESLLDTYHAERHPVAARVLRNTMAQIALRRPDARTKALRDTMSELLGMDEPRRRFAAMISGLDIHYDLGEGHSLLGRRMPDLNLVTANGPLRVFTLLHDARPVLLNLGEPGGFDITPWADRVQLIDAEYVGMWELPVLGAVTAPAAVLIRPDGYVAWVGDLSHLGLPDALTTWFGPPTAAQREGALAADPNAAAARRRPKPWVTRVGRGSSSSYTCIRSLYRQRAGHTISVAQALERLERLKAVEHTWEDQAIVIQATKPHRVALGRSAGAAAGAALPHARRWQAGDAAARHGSLGHGLHGRRVCSLGARLLAPAVRSRHHGDDGDDHRRLVRRAAPGLQDRRPDGRRAAMVLVGAAPMLLARVPAHGTYVGDILPGLLVFGPGLGGGCVAASVAALGCVAEREAGLASATNTAAFQVGGAFGAATVSTVAASRAVGPVESIGRARCRGRRRSER